MYGKCKICNRWQKDCDQCPHCQLVVCKTCRNDFTQYWRCKNCVPDSYCHICKKNFHPSAMGNCSLCGLNVCDNCATGVYPYTDERYCNDCYGRVGGLHWY